MANVKNFIDFTLVTDNDEIRVKTYAGEYADLRLLLKEYVGDDDFGQCGGMGRCATCMVVVSSNLQRTENSSDYLSTRYNSRPVKLSCQLAINDELANKYIKVLSA